MVSIVSIGVYVPVYSDKTAISDDLRLGFVIRDVLVSNERFW